MTAPGSPPRRPRAAWLAALVLVLTLLAGGLSGVALDRLVLLPRKFGRPGLEQRLGRPPRDHAFRDRFAKEVGLSTQQRTQIDSIMDRESRELRAIRGRVQPQLDSIITRTRRSLDSVLTPEQREKAAAIRRRHPRPPRPHGGFPSEHPEGPPPAAPPP